MPSNCHQMTIKCHQIDEVGGGLQHCFPIKWCKSLVSCVVVWSLKKKTRSRQRANVYSLVDDFSSFCGYTFMFVSLSMIFQASRFSASGRRVPLEPRRSEACRSCQPMHVLSFGEGRSFWFLGSSQSSSTCVWQVRASIVVVTG